MTDEQFVEASSALGCQPTDPQLVLLNRYRDLLTAWSQRVRLVSRGDVDYLQERHFLDSVSLIPHLGPGPLLDLGTGGGLPGIPIKILQPDRQVLLVDSVRMKCLFLRQAVAELELPDTDVRHQRVESLQEEEGVRGKMGIVTARAVTELRQLWEWSAPLLREGGYLVAMKGPDETDQWMGAESWPAVGGVSLATVSIPSAGRERAILRLQKVQGD